MKTLALLAALALGTALTGQAVACEGSNCAVEQPDAPTIPQTPADCGSTGCAVTPPPVIVADGGGCSNCAVEQPDTPSLPQTPADGQGCSG